MDDDIIDDLAAALFGQLEFVNTQGGPNRIQYLAAINDDILAIGLVIHAHTPTYDMRYFYKNAGFPEPYPVHDMM